LFGRQSLELEILEGRMFDWDLDLAWAEEDGFLRVAKSSVELQKQ
jgi:hypothetical protein